MKFNNPQEFLDHWFNQCIPMVHSDHPENTLYYYDINILRTIKLSHLNSENINIKFKPTDDSIILFYQDQLNGWFYVHHEIIWLVLKEDFNLNVIQTRESIDKWLEQQNIFNLVPITNKAFPIY